MSKRVALGIAHTESKPGASTPDKKIYENAYSRELCMMIYDELYRQTPMTEAFIIERPEPNDISGEIEAVNSIENLSCYIAFHANAFNGHVDGCEMLHYKGSKWGEYLAELLQFGCLSVLRNHHRGVKAITKDDRGGVILAGVYPPAVIAEPFFIDNFDEFKNYEEKKGILAKVLANTIVKYLEMEG